MPLVNDATERQYQDVGFDGLDNAGEKKKGFYLAALKIHTNKLIAAGNSPILLDDYTHYRDASLPSNSDGILKKI
jgi:hypothetical protein